MGRGAWIVHASWVVLLVGVAGPRERSAVASPAAAPTRSAVRFEENRGQARADARFVTRAAGGTASFGDAGVTLYAPSSRDPLHLTFVGGRRDAKPQGSELRVGRINYLRGSDPSRWVTGVRTYGAVTYPAVYEGIDVRFHADRGPLEYDVLLAPGADVSAFGLRVDGASSLVVDDAGRLVAHTAGGKVVQDAPVAWQERGSRRESVSVRFDVREKGIVGFSLGAYDRSRALVIDPAVAWASFLGGDQRDSTGLDAMAVASDGSILVAGETGSSDFPVVGNSSAISGDWDGFVTRFAADGATLVWSTYLGGSGYDGVGDIALDAAGNLVVVGYTYSSDFPTTSGAYQTAKPGGTGVSTAFVTKLDTTGAIAYSTLVGGTDYCSFNGVAIGPTGLVYAAGWAREDFPTTQGAYDRTHNGGTTTPNLSLTVLDLTASGSSALTYSTYVSGEFSSRAFDVAVDSSGDAYLVGTSTTYTTTGRTTFTQFPTTSNAYIPSISIPRNSIFDSAFFLKLRPGGQGSDDLLYSTWISPKQSFGEFAQGVCVTSGGIAYVAGALFSDSGFTATSNAYDTSHNGHRDAIVCGFDASQSGPASRTYATFVGGDGQDQFEDVALDATGRLLLTGSSGSPNADGKGKNKLGVPYPSTSDAVQTVRAGGSGGGDVVVTILDLTQSGSAQMAYSTFFGGTGGTVANGRGWDWGRAISSAPDGGIAVYALFESDTDFPSVGWGYDATPNGDVDVGVIRFAAP